MDKITKKLNSSLKWLRLKFKDIRKRFVSDKEKLDVLKFYQVWKSWSCQNIRSLQIILLNYNLISLLVWNTSKKIITQQIDKCFQAS